MAGILPDFPETQGEQYQPGINPATIGGFGTPAIGAFLQMFDRMGLSPEQMNQNDAMRGPLLRSAYAQHPELLGQPHSPSYNADASRRALGEDLNSVMIKFNNWRHQNFFGELTPQQRVMQGFIDVRNPNSRF